MNTNAMTVKVEKTIGNDYWKGQWCGNKIEINMIDDQLSHLFRSQ